MRLAFAGRRRWLTALGGVALLALLTFAVLHAPPVRRALLSRITSQLEQAGVVFQVERLDYNLARLEIRLERPSLAVPATRAEPFFTADAVHARFGWGVVLGRIEVREFEADRPRIQLTRTAAGSNWPSSASGSPSALPDINLGRVRVSDLTIIWRDGLANAGVDASNVSLELNPAGAVSSGWLRLGGAARVRARDRETTIKRLDARLSWNGRDLSVDALRAAADEGMVQIDGRAVSLTSNPQLDLRVASDVNLAPLARLLVLDRPFAGALHIDAAISGRPSALDATVTLAGHDVAFGGLRGAQIETSGSIAANQVDLAALSIRFPGGLVTGRGHSAIDASSGAFSLDWRVDLATSLRAVLARDPPLQPSALASGFLQGSWSAPRLDAVRMRSESRLTADKNDENRIASAATGAAKTPARIPLEGPITFELDGKRLTLHADQHVGPGSRTQTIVDIASQLDPDDLSRSPVRGTFRMNAPDLAHVAELIARSGITESAVSVGGSAIGDFVVGGTLAAPRIDGTLDANDVRYDAVGPAAIHSRLSASRTEVAVDDLQATLGANSTHGRGRVSLASEKIDGRFDAALNDVSRLAGAVALPIDMTGTLDASATLSGSLTAPSVAATVTTKNLVAASQQIDRLEADARFVNRELLVDRFCLAANENQGAQGSANPENLENPCQLTGRGRINPAQRTYTINAAATNLIVRPISNRDGKVIVPLATKVSGAIEGDGSFTRLGGRGRLMLVETRWDDIDLGPIEADLTAAGRQLSATVRAPDLAAEATGDVGIEPDGAIAVHGRWTPTDLGDMARRVGWTPPVSLSGSTSLSVDVSGARDQLQNLRLTVNVDRLTVDAEEQHVTLAQPARLEYDGRVARVRDLTLTTGSTSLAVAGSLGEPASTLMATVRGSLADFAVVEKLARRSGLPPATGDVDLQVSATGSIEHPDLSGSVRVTGGKVPVSAQHDVTDATLAADYSSGVLTIDQLRAAFEGASLTASGRIPADLFRDRIPPRWRELVPESGGTFDLQAQLSSVTERVAAPFVDASTLEQLQGQMDATVALHADRAALDGISGSMTLDRANLSLAGVSFDQQRPTRLTIRDGRIDIADWEWGRGDNRLTLGGGAELGGSQLLDLTARAAVDLRLLGAFSGSARPSGGADAALRLGGTVNDPSLNGFATFSNGEIRLADPRLIVADLSGTITLDRDSIRLERLYATVNGGESEISGSLRHRWLKPLDGRVDIRARGTAIDLYGLRAETDADLTLAIEPRGPLVSGAVTLVRSSYREPLSLTGGLLRALRASSGVAAPDSGSVLDDVRLDIGVKTGDDLVVDNNYAKVTAGADLRVGGTAAQPVPIGRVTLAEGGTIFFGGNRYRLDRQGSIDFTNPAVIEPDLDLRAKTQVRELEIVLELKGTPETLQSSLRSPTDPRLSTSELVSLLVTGRTDALAAGYTPGAEELLGYFSGELFGTAARAIGMDVLRVERGNPNVRFDAGLVASETDPAARLTFGKNLGRRTQVVFSQSLRESGGLTWIVSYAPRSQAELRAVALDNGDRLYDFRHDVMFGETRVAPVPPRAPEPRVTAVTISGAGADETTLRRLVHVGVGDRFSFFRWQDDRDRMEAYYHDRDRAEARVTTRRSDAGAGTAISYDVRTGPRTSMVIEGFAVPPRVTDAVKAAWTHAIIDEFLVSEVDAIIRGELVDRGYMRPSVTARIDGTADAKQLRVTIAPGPHTRDRRIVFTGNEEIATAQLQQLIRDPDLARAVWLNPTLVRDRLIAFYRSEGFLNATVGLGDIAIEDDLALRAISISEGEPFRVREVHIDGVDALPASDVTRASSLAGGERFSESLIERARRGIIQSYRKQGFNGAGVTLRTEAVPDAAAVDVAVTVEEGARQRLREVVTEGNARTRPELVARALKLEPGQPVDLAAWSSARRRLYELGVFRSVDIQPEPIAAEPKTPAEQPIRAHVTLEEWPPVRLRYGLEVEDQQSSERTAALEPSGGGRTFDVGVGGELASRSLFGHALSAGVAGRYTRDFRAARTYVTTPSLFGLPITSNIFLARSREALGEAGAGSARKFVTDVTSLTLEQRTRPRGDLEIAYRYAFEHNHTFDLHPDPDNPLPFDIPVTIARLGTTALFDTRNDLVDTTTGWFHSSDFEYSPTSLGTDVRFVRYLLQQRYFQTAGRIVFGGAARVGLASAFGQRLIPSERFFAGGGNSVRGYDEDALSPHDVLGFAVGGTSLVVLNAEARFPILRRVRGVGFFDAGRAFDTVRHLSFGDLSAGTGAGLRVDTPFVLLRIDYGIPLDSTIGGRRGRWFFSVGQAF